MLLLIIYLHPKQSRLLNTSLKNTEERVKLGSYSLTCNRCLCTISSLLMRCVVLFTRAMRWWRESDQLLRSWECSGVVPKLTTPSSLSIRATTVPDTTSWHKNSSLSWNTIDKVIIRSKYRVGMFINTQDGGRMPMQNVRLWYSVGARGFVWKDWEEALVVSLIICLCYVRCVWLEKWGVPVGTNGTRSEI